MTVTVTCLVHVILINTCAKQITARAQRVFSSLRVGQRHRSHPAAWGSVTVHIPPRGAASPFTSRRVGQRHLSHPIAHIPPR